jgi:hypothetical protein
LNVAPVAESPATRPETVIDGVTTAEDPVYVSVEGVAVVTVIVSALLRVKVTAVAVAVS